MSGKIKVPIMEKELNSCLVIFELSGLQYFSLKSLTAENVKSRPSWVRFIFMLVLLFTLTGLVLWSVYVQESEADHSVTTKNLLGFIIQQSMNAGLILVTVTTLIESYTSTNNMKQLYLNQKEIVQAYSQHFDIVIDFKKLKKMATRRGLALVGFYLGINGILTVVHMETEKYFMLFLIGLLPVLFLFMAVLKFLFYVSVVNEQLTFLMNYLEEIFKHDTINIIEGVNHRMIQLKPRSTKPADDHIRKLRSAVKIYGIIHENAGLINASIGWSVLSFLLCLTTATTVSGYQLFVILVGGLSLDHLPNALYVLVVSGAVLISTVAYCQQTQFIMSTFATTVKKLQCQYYEQLQNETLAFLQNFYVQLVLQPIFFTAASFYVINFALLAGITTGIASYEIILVQFYASK